MSSLSSGRSSVNNSPCAAAGTLVWPCGASLLGFTALTSWERLLLGPLQYASTTVGCVDRCSYTHRITGLCRRYGCVELLVNYHWTFALRRVALAKTDLDVQLR